MTLKVGDMEDNPREEIRRRTMKEVVDCVQAVMGKKPFIVQFKDGNKRDRDGFFFAFVCIFQRVFWLRGKQDYF